jgi:hypothetical protein
VQQFVQAHGIKVLNIAGSRESKEPGVHDWTLRVLSGALFWDKSHPGMLGGPDEG